MILNIRKISLYVTGNNLKAKNLYKKFGFGEEGVLIKHAYLENDYHDIYIMALFRSDYYRLYPQNNK